MTARLHDFAPATIIPRKSLGISNDRQDFGAAAVETGQELRDGRRQIGDAAEQVIVRDFAAQMFPEPLDQVKLGQRTTMRVIDFSCPE